MAAGLHHVREMPRHALPAARGLLRDPSAARGGGVRPGGREPRLFFADLVVRTGRGNGEGVLPRYEAVIFDEAHALEDAATEFFGTSVSSHRLRGARARRAGGAAGGGCASGLPRRWRRGRAEAEALWAAAPRVVGMTRGRTVRLTAGPLAPLRAQLEAVLEGLGGASRRYASGHEEPRPVRAGPPRGRARGRAGLRPASRVDGPRLLGRGAGPRRCSSAPRPSRSARGDARAALRRGGHRGLHLGDAPRRRAASSTSAAQVGLLDAEGEAVAPLTQLAVPSLVRLRDPVRAVPAHAPARAARARVRRGGGRGGRAAGAR